MPMNIMVDCSHGNSQKDFKKQTLVLQNIIQHATLCVLLGGRSRTKTKKVPEGNAGTRTTRKSSKNDVVLHGNKVPRKSWKPGSGHHSGSIWALFWSSGGHFPGKKQFEKCIKKEVKKIHAVGRGPALDRPLETTKESRHPALDPQPWTPNPGPPALDPQPWSPGLP